MSAEDLNPAVLAALPPGSEIISIVQHGKTNWSTGFLKLNKASSFSNVVMADPKGVSKHDPIETKDGTQAEEQPATKITETFQTPAPYSIFTTKQKRWILAIAALAGWFSTTSSFIYFPAIPFISQDLGVTVEQVSLTVMSYLIAAGIFPAISGSAADKCGRRVVFMISLGVYFAINVSLAVQRSFVTLFVLRILQSAAISGTYSIAYGVIGDLVTPAERGGYTGVLSVFLNTPPSVSSLISGLLLIRWTWPAIFWFLAISSPAVLLAVVLFMLETCRAIVQNGSRRPPPLLRPIFPLLSPLGQEQTDAKATDPKDGKKLLNPLSVLLLLKSPGTLLAIFCFSVYYTIYSCLQASLSTVFVEVYNTSGLVSGIIYIPFGVAQGVTAYFGGRVLDFDYRRTAKARGLTIDKHGGDDVSKFPIEYARLRTSRLFLVACGPLIVGYGWALQHRTHMAVPLVLQFFIGATNQMLFTSINTLLVDFHPESPSSVQAANNLVRCEFAAIWMAVLDKMLKSLGPGWCFVVFAALHMLTLPMLWVLARYGVAWRQKTAR